MSTGVRRNLLKTGIPADRIEVIANPVSERIARFATDDRGAWEKLPENSPLTHVQWPVDELRIGYFGRFSPEKGPDRMLRWFARWRAFLPARTRLYLAGMGSMAQELPSLAQQLGIAESVEWVGSCAIPLDFLPYLDIAVSPSRYEGLPIAMIESAALGCRILASETAGSEALSRLVPDLLLVANEDGQDEATLARIAAWIRDGKPRSPLSARKANLLDQARSAITPRTVAQEYLALYERGLQRKRKL